MGAGHSHALYVHGHTPLHRAAPQVKVAAAFGFVAAVAVTPREAIWAFLFDAALVGLAIVVARLPLRFVLARLVIELPFVAFALALPFIGTGQTTEVGPFALQTEGLWAAWNILAKATIGALVAIVLAGTTQIPDLLRGLERLRVPAPMVAIAGFMVRYLDVIAGEFRRTRTAMTARGYDPRWLWQVKPIAQGAGTLFVRSYERGERVHRAMVARGYTGTMPRLDDRSATTREWTVGLLLPLLAAATSGVAWLVAP